MNDDSKYGPQSAEVEALLARARTLTDTEVRALVAELSTANDLAWYRAWESARRAAPVTEWEAAFDAAQAAAPEAARGIVSDAVCALVARDLTDPTGFTQAHYDLLTGPWQRVIGAVHTADVAVAA